MFILILSLCMEIVLAKSSCGTLGSEEMLSLNVNGKNMIACGENSTGVVSNLQILSAGEIVFEGDTAFKRYKVYKTEDIIHIEEGLNLKEFKPFLLLKWVCTSSQCEFKVHKCLWKKDKIDTTLIGKVKEIISKKRPISDSLWDSLFISALNGSKEALEFFRNPGSTSDASGSESFSTYLEDLPRLKKAGCI